MQVWPISDYFHDSLLAMPILSDQYTGKPLAQGALFQLLPGRALDVAIGLRESGQAGRVLKIRATGAEDLNPGLETCFESGC